MRITGELVARRRSGHPGPRRWMRRERHARRHDIRRFAKPCNLAAIADRAHADPEAVDLAPRRHELGGGLLARRGRCLEIRARRGVGGLSLHEPPLGPLELLLLGLLQIARWCRLRRLAAEAHLI